MVVATTGTVAEGTGSLIIVLMSIGTAAASQWRRLYTPSHPHSIGATSSVVERLPCRKRKAADRIQRRKGMIVQHVFFHDVPTKDGESGSGQGIQNPFHG